MAVAALQCCSGPGAAVSLRADEVVGVSQYSQPLQAVVQVHQVLSTNAHHPGRFGRWLRSVAGWAGELVSPVAEVWFAIGGISTRALALYTLENGGRDRHARWHTALLSAR